MEDWEKLFDMEADACGLVEVAESAESVQNLLESGVTRRAGSNETT